MLTKKITVLFYGPLSLDWQKLGGQWLKLLLCKAEK
jgi:hypothetical protein